ncbi:MAG: prephenate dehydrogenase/arogenate dehydrogenase family protein [Clostridia bacterium]|nr:prephenate dehydrogenase/arogenate dehydrogenase family protein [Clostridia bacterium]
MKIGICGLGLIGGSMAKAYRRGGCEVYGYDLSEAVQAKALEEKVILGTLDEESVPSCDLVLLCVYPRAAAEYLLRIAPYLHPEAIVVDCCGTKRWICKAGFAIARQYGFTFFGGHPMAGTQYSGLAYSRENLFDGAPMVIVPPANVSQERMDRLRELLGPVGFGSLSVTTAENHDKIIAFTSQLAHVVSNAYVKSPNAQVHRGFSAGSYKDLTRVAWLNEEMWAELFMEDRDNLFDEVEGIIHSLMEYRDALMVGDRERLVELLREGRLAKERVDRETEDEE